LGIIALVMMLSFPFKPAHQYADHFRTTQLTRQIKRSTFVAQPELSGAEQVVVPTIDPVAPLEPRLDNTPAQVFETHSRESEALASRLLLRVRLRTVKKDPPLPLL
jgi:hypothetical protein